MTDQTSTTTFKALGLEFPLSQWGIYGLSAVAVVAALLVVYQRFYSDPERAILTLKEVNQRMAFEVEEYGRHVMEEPTKHELFEDEDGALAVRVYRDHCVLIQRRSRTGVYTRLVPDLARKDLSITDYVAPLSRLSVFPVVHAAQNCQRSCLNPHPGPFQWRYGAQQGDWVEVWRSWPEGCTHVQMFNPRANAWDSNPDGSPRVRWTCCTH